MVRFGLFANALAIGALIAMTQSAHAQSVSPASGAQEQPDHQEHHPAAGQTPDAKAPDAQMMAMQQKMMADMKAADATLDALVTKMNTPRAARRLMRSLSC